jgi:hypothetical protein
MRLKEHISNGAALMFSVVFMVGAAFAGADDVLVSFSTNGAEPDRYADGEVVMNGECYALVWSSDGVFEGLNADGTPIDPNDRVVLVAPVAKNGHCPEVTFQIDAAEAEQQKNGQYGVLLLDTRVNVNGVVSPRGISGGSLSMVNGYGAVAEGQKITSSDRGVTVDALLRGDGFVAGENAASVKGVKQPRIKHIRIVGDKVLLTVENLNGFMRVRGGGRPDSVVTLGGATPTDGGDDDVVLVVPKMGNAGFYSVQRN